MRCFSSVSHYETFVYSEHMHDVETVKSDFSQTLPKHYKGVYFFHTLVTNLILLLRCGVTAYRGIWSKNCHVILSVLKSEFSRLLDCTHSDVAHICSGLEIIGAWLMLANPLMLKWTWLEKQHQQQWLESISFYSIPTTARFLTDFAGKKSKSGSKRKKKLKLRKFWHRKVLDFELFGNAVPSQCIPDYFVERDRTLFKHK